MRLCFDATRFGTGLKEAVQLCATRKLPAVEYTFQPFSAAGKNAAALSADEKRYLSDVRETAAQSGVEIACINLDHCVDLESKADCKKFHAMSSKLTMLAQSVDCKRFSFWIQPGAADDWISDCHDALMPVIDSCQSRGVKPVLRLSTAATCQDQSLRKWRPMEPQEWRNLLAAFPALSLSFSPADCVWQGLDYLQLLPAFTAAIEIVEGRDVEVNRSMIADSGLFGPLWWRYRLPGRGQVDWRQLVEALKLYDFQGVLSLCLDDEFIAVQDLEPSLDFAVNNFAPYVRG